MKRRMTEQPTKGTTADPKIRNPKSEIRNKSEIRIQNDRNGSDRPVSRILDVLEFGFVSDFGFHNSDLKLVRCGVREEICRLSLLFIIVVVSANALASQATPKAGGTLRLARLFDPVTLDPPKVELTEDIMLIPLLHQTLLDVEGGTNLVPSAARDWSTSPDKKVYTFWLRPGVRFSNGRAVVASDYVFSLERLLAPATAAAMSSYMKGIRGAESFINGNTNHVAGLQAPSSDTLIIELERPDPTFGYILLSQGIALPPEEIARRGSRFSIEPVGCGPYVVRDWKRGVRLRLARNPHYHGVEPQHLDGVEILIGGDEATHLMMFERGELDIANITLLGIPLPSLRRLTHDPDWHDLIENEQLFETDFIDLNTEVPPLNNILVRRAINHAINRDKWVRVSAGYATHCEGILPRIMPGFNPALRGYKYDPETARQLLRKSGLALPLHTVLWHGLEEPYRYAAQGVQSDLKQVGIEVELKPVTYSQLASAMGVRGQVPMGISGWNVAIPDGMDMLGQQFDGRAVTNAFTWNYSFYQNPEVDRLLDEAAPEIDLKRRYELYQGVERLIMQDAPLALLGHMNKYALRQRRLKGPLLEPLWIYRFDRVWIQE
jgi:peptide/nickel transport system substrate-binding protein/oligopeptide transport system substrate-binding protein